MECGPYGILSCNFPSGFTLSRLCVPYKKDSCCFSFELSALVKIRIWSVSSELECIFTDESSNLYVKQTKKKKLFLFWYLSWTLLKLCFSGHYYWTIWNLSVGFIGLKCCLWHILDIKVPP